MTRRTNADGIRRAFVCLRPEDERRHLREDHQQGGQPGRRKSGGKGKVRRSSCACSCVATGQHGRGHGHGAHQEADGHEARVPSGPGRRGGLRMATQGSACCFGANLTHDGRRAGRTRRCDTHGQPQPLPCARMAPGQEGPANRLPGRHGVRQAPSAGGAASSAATAFIDRRRRPLSSASMTLTRTPWPSLT